MYSDEEDSEEMVEEFDSSDEYAHENEEHPNTDVISQMEVVPEILSLQQICLQTISDNLERFNEAVTTTTDFHYMLHLHYLRRVHTQFFFNNKIKEDNGILKKKYWDFLLTEYLKELNLSTIDSNDWDDLMMKLDKIGHGIEKIRFDLSIAVEFEKAVVFVKKVVLKLQNLKILHLHSFGDDTILEMLPSCCAKLEELSMIMSCITEKGLISLCQKENNGDETRSLNLRVIDLSGITGINDGVSYLLKNMPSLEIIVYEDLHLVLSNMYKHDVQKASEDKYNLTSFTIPYGYTSNCFPRIQDVLCILSMCCPYIKVLSVPIQIKQDLESISKLSELEDFSAVDISLTGDLDLNWFLKQKGETLKRFKIRNFRISVDTLIDNCPNLESLTFQYTCFHLSDPNINLKQLNNLYELSIKSIHYNDNSKQAVINILNCSPKLENLAFFDCDFKHNDEFATKFTKYCEDSNLHILTFNTCALDMPLLQTILLTCSSLKTLVLDQCYDIDSNNIEALYKVSLSLKNKVEISWKDDRSESNSIYTYSDVFNSDSDFDIEDFDYYESDGYDGYDEYDDEDQYIFMS